MEMADTPLLDTGGYLVLGNDDFFLQMMANGTEPQKVRDYVAWMLDAHNALA